MNPQLRAYLERCGLSKQATNEQAVTFRSTLTGDQAAEATRIEATLRSPEPSNPPAPTPVPGDHLRENPPTPSPAPVPSPPPAPEVSAAIVAERQRIATIRELASDDIDPAHVQRAIDEGWDTQRASEQFLRSLRDARPAPSPPSSGGAPAIHCRHNEATVLSLAGAVMLRDGINCYGTPTSVDLQTGTLRTDSRPEPERARTAEEAERYADWSLYDIAREAVRLDGRSVPHERQATIRAAIGGNSLSAIFTQSIGAMVLAGFNETVDTTEGWTIARDVPNFLTNDRLHASKTGGLTKHKKGGSADHADRSDTAEQYKVHRFSRQFVVDEMDIINDRLGAIEDSTPTELGMAARRLVPDMVYAHLLANGDMADGVALFHADHGNLKTSAALSAVTLRAAVAAMLIQQVNGQNVDVTPFALVVPAELKHLAGELIRSGEIRDTTANTTRGTYNSLLDDNLVRRSDSRLSNGVTDPQTGTAYAGSATTWFLAARGSSHTIEVGYLRGTGRRPQTRSWKITQGGTWGLGWDVKHDVGAKALHWVGLVKNTA